MKNILIAILCLISLPSIGQKAYLNQYSSFCIEEALPIEQIGEDILTDVKKKDNYIWQLEATVFKNCGVSLFPFTQISADTVIIEPMVIEIEKLILENGDSITRYISPEECTCAYEMKMEFSLVEIQFIKLKDVKSSIKLNFERD